MRNVSVLMVLIVLRGSIWADRCLIKTSCVLPALADCSGVT